MEEDEGILEQYMRIGSWRKKLKEDNEGPDLLDAKKTAWLPPFIRSQSPTHSKET